MRHGVNHVRLQALHNIIFVPPVGPAKQTQICYSAPTSIILQPVASSRRIFMNWQPSATLTSFCTYICCVSSTTYFMESVCERGAATSAAMTGRVSIHRATYTQGVVEKKKTGSAKARFLPDSDIIPLGNSTRYWIPVTKYSDIDSWKFHYIFLGIARLGLWKVHEFCRSLIYK